MEQTSEIHPSSDESTIGRLVSQFVHKGSAYSIRKNWVQFLYLRNGRNEEQATRALERDEEVRKNIANQHRNDTKSEERRTTLEDQIDGSCRERNLSLDELSTVPSSELLFDLHWFLKNQALNYVCDIEQAVREDPNRANVTDIHLITGSGVSKRKPPAIRKALKREYDEQIRVSAENHGVLILTISK